MTREDILNTLLPLCDDKYRIFTEKLIFTSRYKVLGIRLPQLKETAKQFCDSYKEVFALPYDSFEELLFKGLCIALSKDSLSEKYDYILKYADLIDNWSSCDCFCSAIKPKKHDIPALWQIIEDIIYSEKEFVSRVGIVLLFSKFHDEKSVDYALTAYEKMPCGQYYRDMAIAWGISVYAVYFPDKISEYLETSSLSADIKKKAAQKIRDSRRISDEVKQKITEIVNG